MTGPVWMVVGPLLVLAVFAVAVAVWIASGFVRGATRRAASRLLEATAPASGDGPERVGGSDPGAETGWDHVCPLCDQPVRRDEPRQPLWTSEPEPAPATERNESTAPQPGSYGFAVAGETFGPSEFRVRGKTIGELDAAARAIEACDSVSLDTSPKVREVRSVAVDPDGGLVAAHGSDPWTDDASVRDGKAGARVVVGAPEPEMPEPDAVMHAECARSAIGVEP